MSVVLGDRGDSVPDKMNWKKVFTHLKDPFVWALGTLQLEHHG